MTEAEWLGTDDPTALLESLKGRASDRKLRMFACGCCRRVWESLVADRVRRAVEAAEGYADGHGTDDELVRFYQQACSASAEYGHRVLGRRIAINRAEIPVELGRMAFSANTCHVHTPYLVGRLKPVGRDVVLRGYAPAILRCLFGNPFRPVAFDPEWRTSTVVALAVGIYADRASDRLPVLADALDDAGCNQPDILAHCRGDGPHVRGCWVLDLVLGKE